MGAALTYARRYTLFPLVGIAGEDDLDAPDLNGKVDAAASAPRSMSPRKPKQGRRRTGRPQLPQGRGHRQHRQRRRQQLSPARRKPPFCADHARPERSAAVREQLLADMGQLQSPDEAADWVHRNLSLKTTLTAVDAHLVEAGFRESLATIEAASTTGEEQSDSAPKTGPAPSGKESFLAWETHPPTRGPRLEPQPYVVVAWRRRSFGCATRSTAYSSPRNHASTAAERPRKPITLVSPNRAHLDERSAMNTRSPFAGVTTAICTATVMKPHGGLGSASTLGPLRSSYGGSRLRYASDAAVSELLPDVIPARMGTFGSSGFD
jgi:hypothetical protein